MTIAQFPPAQCKRQLKEQKLFEDKTVSGGSGDFGANYNRIREFFGILKARGDSGAAAPS